MSTSLFDPSARTAERHIANNQNKTIAPSSMRFCYGPRCRGGSGQSRSIQQFKNKRGEVVYEFCRDCRGVK